MGWGTLLGKVAQQFQTRIERLKNERSSLEKEKAKLIKRTITIKSADRVQKINDRIDKIDEILRNNAKD